MKLTRDLKKAITIILGFLLSSSVASAAPSIKLLRATYNNGADFCSSIKAATCVPVYNNSNDSLYASLDGNYWEISPKAVAVYFDINDAKPGAMVSVYNSNSISTYKSLYSGFVSHKVGLSCNDKSCSDWT